MGEPRSRSPFINSNIKEKQMIIKMKQSKPRFLLDLFVTTFAWVFLILFFHNLISHFHSRFSFKFYLVDLSNSNAIVIFTGFSLLLSSISLAFWSYYNKRKYGPLNRRKFPQPTTQKEMAVMFQKTESEVKAIQNNKYIDIY